MFTRNWPRHLLCLSLGLPLAAMACGPDFPMRLLDNRGQSLAELPEGNFSFEVSRLGHAIAGLKPVTAATLVPGAAYGEASAHVEQRATGVTRVDRRVGLNEVVDREAAAVRQAGAGERVIITIDGRPVAVAGLRHGGGLRQDQGS